MKFSFDEVIDRKGTGSVKLESLMEFYGTQDVLPMWIADMDFATPPFVIDALKKRLEHPILGYTLRQPSFNQSIVSWVKRRHDWTISAEQVVFSPGLVPALSMSVLAFTKPGDKVIVQPPVYPPFFWCVEKNNRILVENPLIHEDGYYRMDFDDLERNAANGARMLILCSPHNPVGRVWREDELREVAGICKKYGVVILSDEIHSDLVFKPNRHVPLPLVAPGYEEQIIVCLSPSKTFNLAGLSTSAMIIGSKDLRNQYSELLDTLHVGLGNVFGFTALEAAYQQGEEWLNQLLDYLAGNIHLVNTFIREHVPQVALREPEATYMVWLDCQRMNLGEKELADFFVHKAGIAPSPGNIFGRGGDGFQRLNIASPRTVIEECLDKLYHAFR
jgi:cysteine-S-conjugate beta-lyase